MKQAPERRETPVLGDFGQIDPMDSINSPLPYRQQQDQNGQTNYNPQNLLGYQRMNSFHRINQRQENMNNVQTMNDTLGHSQAPVLGDNLYEANGHTYGRMNSIRSGMQLGFPMDAAPRNQPQNIIRVIDKDITKYFDGHTKRSAQPKIRWLENKKSQLLGFCLTIAFLGITIAMYGYRWAGVISGSLNTIVCGLAVVVTYQRKKHWHQHPNPIVHIRAVLGIFLAICMLFNVWVDYKPGGDTANCQRLAGFAEFFFLTSELWGLVMACDLFFSLTSPFTSYKRLMRFYHFGVWSIGIAMGCIAGFWEDAGGFFSVSGQAIRYHTNPDLIIGFCLASSGVCCEKDQECDVSPPLAELTECPDSTFDKYQQWPWVLLYSFVIVVLVVSVYVLSLAWQRLYRRGVPKTYNIRLRVLNYVSFFTGAYVFYWILLLFVYMCSFYLTKQMKVTENNADFETVGQVVRQVMAFAVASKGYLDYVIWFAVNSIERKTPNGYKGGESADADVDLSPQVNAALRSEILYYTTSGIKDSVRNIADELITIPVAGAKKKFIKFWSYAGSSFREIRLTYGISDEEYIHLFGATTKERFSEGRSGAFMFFTSDERLIVKTMSQEEAMFLRKIARNYETYMVHNVGTLLTRFYGCHAVSLYGKMYYFVVMGNLFAERPVHIRYDIKGSWVDRNAKVPKRGDKITCRYCNASYTYGSTRNQECGDGSNYHEPDIVLKDNDLMMKIRIDSNRAHRIYDQIHRDSDFLCEQGIMDYSLLVGVQISEYVVESTMTYDDETFFTQPATSVSGPSMYHFGIIDILQQWTFQKKMERFYKCKFKQKDPEGVSAQPPKPYKFRFQQKMARIFDLNSHTRVNPTMQYQTNTALLDVFDQPYTQRSMALGENFPNEDQQWYSN